MSFDKFRTDDTKAKRWEPMATANTLTMSQAGGSDAALRAQSGELTVDGLLATADRAYKTIDQFVTFPDEDRRLKIEESKAETERLAQEARLQSLKNDGKANYAPQAGQDNTLSIVLIGGAIVGGLALVLLLNKKG